MQTKTKLQLDPYLWAICELGESEIAGPHRNNPRIVFYHSFTVLKAQEDEIPWCSSFMCAAHEMSNSRSTRSAAAISWLDWGVEGSGRIGDIAIFTRKGGNHVAFVHVDYKPGDNYVCVLGGNQSNRVCVSYFKADTLIGFRQRP